jgi:hypothetical protein
MARTQIELADILRRYAPDYPHKMSGQQARVTRALQVCRTAHLGGHVELCDRCGHKRYAYNSCRDRHCPKCQSLAKAKWVEKQVADLLPVPYFHVVFTMPPAIAAIALQNQEVVYDILFRVAAETLQRIAKDPKYLSAEIGLLSVLHTWGQNLHFHPHVHCVVPGGGLSGDGDRWIPSRDHFFLPVRVLSRLYRRLFLKSLVAAQREGRLNFYGDLSPLASDNGFAHHLNPVQRKEWVVYAKRPFGGPKQVVDYLGRYTHRVAISNNRLVSMSDGRVSFKWKNYRQGSVSGTMSLDAHDFIGRFFLHVLPKRFVRIRSYGLLATRNRPTKLAKCREILGAPALPMVDTDWKARFERLTGRPIDACPLCRQGRLQVVEVIPPGRDRSKNLLPGSDDPRLLLSKILGLCKIRRIRRLREVTARLDTS